MVVSTTSTLKSSNYLFSKPKLELRKNILQGGPFDGTEKGSLEGTEKGCLDGTAVRFSAIFFRKRGVSMVQKNFQKKFLRVYGFLLDADFCVPIGVKLCIIRGPNFFSRA